MVPSPNPRGMANLGLEPQLCRLGVSAYEGRLNLQLMVIARDFGAAPADTRISFLRLLCNHFLFPQGAVVLVDRRRIHRVIGVIGLALVSKDVLEVELGASLACNLVIAATILHRSSFDHELRRYNDEGDLEPHPLERLLIMAAYHINLSDQEGIRTRLLLAIFHFVLGGPFACRLVARQPIQLRWRMVYDKSTTEESKDLLRMIQLFCYNSDADRYSEDEPEPASSVPSAILPSNADLAVATSDAPKLS